VDIAVPPLALHRPGLQVPAPRICIQELRVMQEPNFAEMTSEDLLTWIENAGKVLDQKIAADKAEITERQLKLARLEARRAGKDMKAKAKPAAPAKPRGRPAQAAAAKAEEPAPQDAA
jgi:hypothetical protein